MEFVEGKACQIYFLFVIRYPKTGQRRAPNPLPRILVAAVPRPREGAQWIEKVCSRSHEIIAA